MKGQPGCTHTEIAHTLGNGDKTQQPARDSEGELAAAAAAPPPPPPVLVLVVLLCCCCFTTRDASRSATRHNRLSRFVFFGTHAEASNGTAAVAAAVAVEVAAAAAAAAAAQQQQ